MSTQQGLEGTPLGILRADHLLGVSLPPGLVLELAFYMGDTDAKLCAHLQKSVLRDLLKIEFVDTVSYTAGHFLLENKQRCSLLLLIAISFINAVFIEEGLEVLARTL